MFKSKKPLTRHIIAPRIEGNDAYRTLARDQRSTEDDDADYAMPPLSFALTLQGLLPDQKRDRPLVVEWNNPEIRNVRSYNRTTQMREYLRATQLPRRLGGLTILEAQTFGNLGSNYTRFEFTSIEDETDFPDVIVRTTVADSHPINTLTSIEPYMDAASGIGVITFGLLAQSDEVLVLAQETRDFVA